MGGRLCFSRAVVDDAGDGLVISSIHARGESRTYAKGIVGGASEITLTPEEQQALAAARGGRGRPRRDHAVPATMPGSRRDRPPLRLPRPRGHLQPDGARRLGAPPPDAERRAVRLGRRGARRPARRRPRRRHGAHRELRRGRGRAPRSTRSRAATRSSSPARCSCRSPSSSPPAGYPPRATSAPSAPTRTRWAQVRALDGRAPARRRLPARRCRPPPPRRASQPGDAPLRRRRLRPGRRPRSTGSRCSPRTSATTPAAVTRFVLVARPGPPARRRPAPTRPRVVLFQRDDHPGGLLELLEQFAARGVNMTRLESRPTGESMGSYCFSIDFEGHVAGRAGGRGADGAAAGLRRRCASSAPTPRRRRPTDAAWHQRRRVRRRRGAGSTSSAAESEPVPRIRGTTC